MIRALYNDGYSYLVTIIGFSFDSNTKTHYAYFIDKFNKIDYDDIEKFKVEDLHMMDA